MTESLRNGPVRPAAWPVGQIATFKSRCFELGAGLLLLCSLVATSGAQGLPPDWPYPWPVGEILEYRILYGHLDVGEVRCSSRWLDKKEDSNIVLQIRVKSNRLISTVYPIEGTLECIVDRTTFRPLRSTRKMREGKRRSDEVNVFDRKAGMGRWQCNIHKVNKKEFEIGPDTFDILSFMYHLRASAMTVGTSEAFELMADEKVYDLELDHVQTDRFKVAEEGKVESVKIRPKARLDGLLTLKDKGDLTAWVSTDERRVCTKLEAETPFANLRIVLKRVTGPGKDFWVDPKKRAP